MKTHLKRLVAIAITVIVSITNSNVSAETTAILTQNISTGRFYQYNYFDLADSLMGDRVIYNDFKTKKVIAYLDDKTGYVSASYLADVYMNRNNSEEKFVLSKYTETAPRDAIINLADLNPIMPILVRSLYEPRVDLTKVWTVKFSKEVVLDDINKQNVTIYDWQGNVVPITLTLGQDEKSILIIPPSTGYGYGYPSVYTLIINSNFHSKDGKKLGYIKVKGFTASNPDF